MLTCMISESIQNRKYSLYSYLYNSVLEYRNDCRKDLVNDLMLGALRLTKRDPSHQIVAPVLDTNVVSTNGIG
jgi:hypothetical protein